MKKFGIIAAALLVPGLAAAQQTQVRNVWDIFGFIRNILDVLLPLIIAAAVVYFIYGVARYVLAGSDDAKEAAKQKIIWGIIALFVMISVWGLVNILVNTFNLDNRARIDDPIQQIPGLPR